MSEKPIEIFDLDEKVLVFLGQWGIRGLLLHRPDKGWEFHRSGSRPWDAFHQKTYLNFKASRLSREELEKRGIAVPPLEEYWDQPAVSREENFPSAVSLDDVPAEVLSRMDKDQAVVYLVLFEDRYETVLGDGKFVYSEAAFWDLASAEAHIEKKQKEGTKDEQEWHEYSLKEIPLHVDRSRRELRADLDPKYYEYFSVKSVLSHLAGTYSPFDALS